MFFLRKLFLIQTGQTLFRRMLITFFILDAIFALDFGTIELNTGTVRGRQVGLRDVAFFGGKILSGSF